MRSLLAIAALLLGLLCVGAAIDVAFAHDHGSSASDHHHQDAHDPTDHSHPPGEDLAHQIAFHGGIGAVDMVLADLALPTIGIHQVAIARTSLPNGITIQPPDRPPSR